MLYFRANYLMASLIREKKMLALDKILFQVLMLLLLYLFLSGAFQEAGNLDNYMQWFYDNLTAFIHIDDDIHAARDANGVLTFPVDDPNITTCDSIQNIHDNTITIVNPGDKIKTKARRYWYNTVARNLF